MKKILLFFAMLAYCQHPVAAFFIDPYSFDADDVEVFDGCHQPFDRDVELNAKTLMQAVHCCLMQILCTMSNNDLIHIMTRSGNLFGIEYCLDKNQDINKKNKFGKRALDYAVELIDDNNPEKKEIIEILIAAGANPELQDDDNQSPIDKAKSWGDEEIQAILINSPVLKQRKQFAFVE